MRHITQRKASVQVQCMPFAWILWNSHSTVKLYNVNNNTGKVLISVHTWYRWKSSFLYSAMSSRTRGNRKRLTNLCNTHTHTHTHTRSMALCPGLPGSASTKKEKPIWILLKQETVSGSGFSWAKCKSAPCSRQIPHQHLTAQFFTGRMPFVSPNQQRQSTEGKQTYVTTGQLRHMQTMPSTVIILARDRRSTTVPRHQLFKHCS